MLQTRFFPARVPATLVRGLFRSASRTMDTAQNSPPRNVSLQEGADLAEEAVVEGLQLPSSDKGGRTASVKPSLLCVQCTRELRDPHLLCCLHCACKECLGRVEQQDGRLKCPQCEDTSTVTHPTEPEPISQSHCFSTTVGRVPVPITINRREKAALMSVPITCTNQFCSLPAPPAAVVQCVDCEEHLCTKCLEGHRMMGKLTERHVVRSMPVEVVGEEGEEGGQPCLLHSGQQLQLYCEHCSCVFCKECAAAEGMHAAHSLKVIDDAVLSHVADMMKSFENTVRECCVKYEKAMNECASKQDSVDHYGKEAVKELHAFFDSFHEVLRRREEEMEQQVERVVQQKREYLSKKIQQCTKEKDSLESVRGSVAFLLEGSLHQVLPLKPLVANRKEALMELGNKECFNLTVSACIGFVSDKEQTEAIITAISKLGCVQEGASPLHCTVEPKLDAVCQFSSQPVVFTLTAVDSNNIPCSSGGESVEAFLRPRPPVPGPSIKAKVEDRQNGQYTITLEETNQKSGYELCVMIDGCHIQGSPSPVATADGDSPLDLLPPTYDASIDISGEYGISQGFLQFPTIPSRLWGIAISHNGTIFVADNSSGLIHVFDGQRNHMVTLNFSQRGSMWYPRGLTTNEEGHLFVANDNGIDVFSEDGKFLHRFWQGGQLSGASDVVISKADQRVYVADTYNHRVAVFSQDGRLLHTFGSKGSGAGQFDRPSGLALSSSGLRLFVSDWGSSRIQVFTAEGVYISEFGHTLLNYPRDVVTTDNGRVLVADNGNNRIAVFSERGEVVGVFGRQGLEAGCLWNPTALAVDTQGDLFVTEYNNARVQIFKI